MALTIRDARGDELDEIADVLGAAYEQYMPAPDADMPDDVRKLFDEYRAEVRDVRSRLAESQLIVAEDEGRIAGAVTFYPPSDVARASSQGGRDGEPEIRLLGVHPDARGHGIGRALTEECIRRARSLGAPSVGLHTNEMMAVARAMYRRMGFVRVPEYDFWPTPDLLVEAYRLDL